MSVMVATSLGEFVIDLFTDRCPLTCKNFLKLCKIKYYNGCLFHMVQKDFTAQTGDPSGTGSGGDSVYKFLYGDQARFFNDEIYPDLKHTKMGTVAMASAGENLNASQFYITLRDDIDSLDEKHTVFGEVAEGIDTLTRLNDAYVDEKGRPFKNIRIKHTYILEDPFEDPPQLSELIPDASPEGKPKEEVDDDDVRLEDDWEPMDEQLAPEDLEEVIRTKEAHSRAVVLESIGDIPDADVKPPENVLFVCKLNPVTEDEDLHTIFSRFGTVTSAEVIRDFKTGDSLCYAFIEFENNDACERAYFKMDNALIDDRRIKVDFSQSVSKLWNQFRRKGKQGRGCFKCGELDHMARDCTMDSNNLGQQQQKFVLKHDNQQHGDKDSGYEMVFDEDSENPQQERTHRDYEQPDRKRHKFQRSDFDDDKHKSYGNRQSRDKERRQYKNDEQQERENSCGRDDRRRESKYGRIDDSERGNSPGRDDKRKGSRLGDRSEDRQRDNSVGRDDRRSERTYGDRSDRYHRKRRNDVEYKNKTEEIDRLDKRGERSRMRDTEADHDRSKPDDHHRGKNDEDYRKKAAETDRRDDASRKKDVDTERDRSRRGDHHRGKNDEEYRTKTAEIDRRDQQDDASRRKHVETERDRIRRNDHNLGKNNEEYSSKAAQIDKRDKRDEPSRKRDAETDRDRSRRGDDHHHGKTRDEKDDRRRGDRR